MYYENDNEITILKFSLCKVLRPHITSVSLSQCYKTKERNNPVPSRLGTVGNQLLGSTNWIHSCVDAQCASACVL